MVQLYITTSGAMSQMCGGLCYSKEYGSSLPMLSSIPVNFRLRCTKGTVLTGLQMVL